MTTTRGHLLRDLVECKAALNRSRMAHLETCKGWANTDERLKEVSGQLAEIMGGSPVVVSGTAYHGSRKIAGDRMVIGQAEGVVLTLLEEREALMSRLAAYEARVAPQFNYPEKARE